MNVVFGMVSTRHSFALTKVAIDSFLRTTPLGPGDEFLLIDNDRSIVEPLPAGVTLLQNTSPRSFAANMNVVLRRAMRQQADAVLLNNDLVFTTGWYEPMAAETGALVSPASNAEVHYTHGAFECRFTMDLSEYVGHEDALEAVAEYNRRHPPMFVEAHAIPFFCVRIPREVIETVGFLDERFVTGAEDKDYCIRALQAGFAVRYAARSFVLHFQGQSTWRGPETPEETYLRGDAYARRFLEKWGQTLMSLFIANDVKALDATPDLRNAWDAKRFKAVVDELVRRQDGAGHSVT
ncbi:MAG TPA: hypothetical protein VND92_03995 [Vicinamibacterales bacterium]|nr:hypothetical protein [Vicinamibacterales bacterium]